MHGPHPFNQLQMLTSQQQQQLMLAQQNLTSPSASDVESRRLKMLLNNRSMSLGKDGLTNSVGDVVPNIGSPLQAVLPRGDPDMLIKVPLSHSLLYALGEFASLDVPFFFSPLHYHLWVGI